MPCYKDFRNIFTFFFSFEMNVGRINLKRWYLLTFWFSIYMSLYFSKNNPKNHTHAMNCIKRVQKRNVVRDRQWTYSCIYLQFYNFFVAVASQRSTWKITRNVFIVWIIIYIYFHWTTWREVVNDNTLIMDRETGSSFISWIKRFFCSTLWDFALTFFALHQTVHSVTYKQYTVWYFHTKSWYSSKNGGNYNTCEMCRPKPYRLTSLVYYEV